MLKTEALEYAILLDALLAPGAQRRMTSLERLRRMIMSRFGALAEDNKLVGSLAALAQHGYIRLTKWSDVEVRFKSYSEEKLNQHSFFKHEFAILLTESGSRRCEELRTMTESPTHEQFVGRTHRMT